MATAKKPAGKPGTAVAPRKTTAVSTPIDYSDVDGGMGNADRDSYMIPFLQIRRNTKAFNVIFPHERTRPYKSFKSPNRGLTHKLRDVIRSVD